MPLPDPMRGLEIVYKWWTPGKFLTMPAEGSRAILGGYRNFTEINENFDLLFNGEVYNGKLVLIFYETWYTISGTGKRQPLGYQIIFNIIKDSGWKIGII